MATFDEITIGQEFLGLDGKKYLKIPQFAAHFTDKEYNAICLGEVFIEDALLRFKPDEKVIRTKDQRLKDIARVHGIAVVEV